MERQSNLMAVLKKSFAAQEGVADDKAGVCWDWECLWAKHGL
jgi:hypothetical protein